MSDLKVKRTRSRLWCFTNFDLEFNYEGLLTETSAEYIMYGVEVCPKTQKVHHQGLVYFSNQRGSIKGVASDLGKCHVEACQGSLDQNRDYCGKEGGEIVEYGSRPSQGKRMDLDEVKTLIQEGKLSADDICENTPSVYHMYGRTICKLEDIALRSRYRNWMTTCEWIYGDTHTGKSHRCFEGFNPKTHYVFTNDNGWWDGYTGQETVIINEFRGGIPYAELLCMIDKWPHNVKRRGREPVPFLAKHIKISSCKSPYGVYSGILEKDDSIEQLIRRIDVIKLTQKWSEGNTVTSDPKKVDYDSDEGGVLR